MQVPTTERELTTWLMGDSPTMRQLREVILRVAPAPIPVWIEGETGSGKEQVALALHAASGRPGPFVVFNVCALSDALFEDALFGHVLGAFTGAARETTGYLGEADGGTLFMDEIGDLSVGSQVKLLRAIETKTYRQVGGRRDRCSDFRVIVASNRPFASLVREGHFRPDLGFRLRGVALKVAPLRDHAEDIPILAAHFIRNANGHPDGCSLAPARLWLEQQRWTGNVRELRQLVLCALALSEDRTPTDRDLRSAQEMLGFEKCERAEVEGALDRERAELLALLARCHWSTAEAANALGIARRTVYRRMRRLMIGATESARIARTLTSSVETHTPARGDPAERVLRPE